MIIRKKYLDKIHPFVDKPVIKVITGIRRCGKSTFLKMLVNELLQRGVKKQQIVLIQKDSLEFDDISDYKQLHNYVTAKFKNLKGKKYIFIDEVQEIIDWEKAVSGFLTDNIGDIYITGSNSKMLSSELATLLSGRYIEIPIYPLTFDEFLQFRKVKKNKDIEKEFDFYMRYGGFPGIHHIELHDEPIYQYINSLYNTILLKDVISRNKIRDVPLLESVVRFVAGNCGNITSAKSIADFIKSQHLSCTADTIQSYLHLLSSAFLFRKTSRYDIIGKRLLEIHEKYFLGDIGLKHGIMGFRKNDISGHLENIVCLEMLSRGYSVSIGKIRELEVDFIARRNQEVLYIQVTANMSSGQTREREFGALEKIADNYPKIVLSLDKYLDDEHRGIKWMNLIEFLTGTQDKKWLV